MPQAATALLTPKGALLIDELGGFLGVTSSGSPNHDKIQKSKYFDYKELEVEAPPSSEVDIRWAESYTNNTNEIYNEMVVNAAIRIKYGLFSGSGSLDSIQRSASKVQTLSYLLVGFKRQKYKLVNHPARYLTAEKTKEIDTIKELWRSEDAAKKSEAKDLCRNLIFDSGSAMITSVTKQASVAIEMSQTFQTSKEFASVMATMTAKYKGNSASACYKTLSAMESSGAAIHRSIHTDKMSVPTALKGKLKEPQTLDDLKNIVAEAFDAANVGAGAIVDMEFMDAASVFGLDPQLIKDAFGAEATVGKWASFSRQRNGAIEQVYSSWLKTTADEDLLFEQVQTRNSVIRQCLMEAYKSRKAEGRALADYATTLTKASSWADEGLDEEPDPYLPLDLPALLPTDPDLRKKAFDVSVNLHVVGGNRGGTPDPDDPTLEWETAWQAEVSIDSPFGPAIDTVQAVAKYNGEEVILLPRMMHQTRLRSAVWDKVGFQKGARRIIQNDYFTNRSNLTTDVVVTLTLTDGSTITYRPEPLPILPFPR